MGSDHRMHQKRSHAPPVSKTKAPGRRQLAGTLSGGILAILLVVAVVGVFAQENTAESNSRLQPAVHELNQDADSAPDSDDSASPSADTDVPDHLASPRATMTTFLEAANVSDYERAAECLDFSAVDEELTRSRRENYVFLLKECIDRLAWVNLESMPDAVEGAPYNFPPNRPRQPITIARGDDGAWRFSPITVKQLPTLFEELKDKSRVAGQDWLRDLFPPSWTYPGFILPLYMWVSVFVVIILGVVVDYISRYVLARLTDTWLRLTKIDIPTTEEHRLWKPAGLLIRAVVWYSGMLLIGLPPRVLDVLEVAVKFFAVVAAVWTAFLATDVLARFLARRAEKTATKFDDLLVPLVSRSLKFFVVAMGIVSMAQTFDLPITGLLSGLGIGGLAIGFAAQDAIGNLFGSLTVLVDRPFEIGDWVNTLDIEGTVESVGIRSTRVRTFYNSEVIVPNCLLTTAVVDNYGRRQYRRIKTTLGVLYDTPPEKIDAFCEGIREIIRRHPYTRKDYYHVYFNAFSSSSLDILLYCFLDCPDWSVELRERHRLFCDILRLAQSIGVEFAFPTQTLHVFEEQHPPDEPLADGFRDAAQVGRRNAARIAGAPVPAVDRPGPVEFTGPHTEFDEEASSQDDA